MDQRHQHPQQPLAYQFRLLLEVVTGGCLEIPVIMFTTTLHQLRTIMDIEVIPQFSAMVEREQQEKAVLFTIMVDLFKLLVTVNLKVKHFFHIEIVVLSRTQFGGFAVIFFVNINLYSDFGRVFIFTKFGNLSSLSFW